MTKKSMIKTYKLFDNFREFSDGIYSVGAMMQFGKKFVYFILIIN